MNIQLQAYLDTFTPRKDGSFSIRFSTQELDDKDLIAINRAKGGFGHLLFAENEFSEKDIPVFSAEEEGKSPSKRLRNTLFVYWKTYKEGDVDWDQFYKEKMEGLINQIKGKLPAKPDDLKNFN